jgi:putative restriction endonuclease
LLRSKEARDRVFQEILERWWPETIHDEIRDELGMEESRAPTKPRDAKFVDQVLENYRFTCSFCGFHAMLNRQAIGVDACHIRWHSAGGPDVSANGIALCKLHHWAFDKGVITLDLEMRICTASAFVVHSDGGLPLHSLSGKSLICGPGGERPGAVYLQWHRANVYLG